MMAVITTTTGTVPAATVPPQLADNYLKSTVAPMKGNGVKRKILRVGVSLLTNQSS